MNRSVNIPHLIIDDRSGSTQFPNPFGNEDGGDSGRRTVVTPSHWSSLPPISPYSKISTIQQQLGSQNFSPGPSIPRSMSQPSPIFSSLPPVSPSSALFRDSPSSPSLLPIRRSPNSVRVSDNSKAHKRCNSDISFGSDSIFAQSPTKWSYPKPIDIPVVGVESEDKGIKERQAFGESMDQVFSVYMNLDKSDALKGNENIGDDMERNSSEESSVNEIGSTTLGVKRRAGKDIAPSSSHLRSVSVDTCVYGKLSTGVESPKPPLSPGIFPPTYSVNGTGMFTASEMNKIAGNNKLSELAVSAPKNVKRILANRESAARSKQRKARYISELEAKLQTVQTENTTITTKFNHLQRDHMVLENQHRELRIRNEGTEKQVHLLEALNEQLNARLREVTGEVSQNRRESDRSNMQQSLSANMFQQLNINQLHQPQRNPDFDEQI